MSSVPTNRRPRLPARVRSAIAVLEREFTDGDDASYAAALAELSAACADLDDARRALVDAELAAAKDRAEAAAFTATAVAALRTGVSRTVEVLPGGVEVLEVTSEILHQLVVTVPAPLPGDGPRTTALVDEARAAVLDGRCPRCGTALRAGVADQLEFAHTDRCPLGPDALAKVRAAGH